MKNKKAIRITAVCLALFLAEINLTPVHATSWEFQPAVEVKASYTDNVRLSVDAQRQSDQLLELSPGFTLEGEGGKSRVNLDYRLQALRYRENTQANNQYQQLDMTMNSDVINKLLTVDVTANQQQSIIDDRDAGSSNTAFITNNRTDLSTYQISPNLNWEINPRTVLSVRPSWGEVKYPDLDGSDSKINQTTAVINSPARAGLIGWQANWQNREVSFENDTELALGQASLGVIVPVAQRTQASFSAGRERSTSNGVSIIEADQQQFWRLGFQWQPSPRTVVSASTGHRYFGDTYSLNFSHRTRYSNWAIDYNEDVQTSSLALQPAESTQTVEQLPAIEGIGTITLESFVNKAFRGTVTWTKGKSTINFQAINEQREVQLTASTQETQGASATYLWQYSAKTDMQLVVTTRKTTFEDTAAPERRDRLNNTDLRLTHQLSRTLVSEFTYSINQQKSSEATSDYKSRLVSILVRGDF